MITAILENTHGREPIGRFIFAALPRIGEEIVIPWPSAPDDIRIFTVSDVRHAAARFPAAGEEVQNQVGPHVFLTVEELA